MPEGREYLHALNACFMKLELRSTNCMMDAKGIQYEMKVAAAASCMPHPHDAISSMLPGHCLASSFGGFAGARRF